MVSGFACSLAIFLTITPIFFMRASFLSSFSGVVGIFPVDFVIAFFLFTVVIRMSPLNIKILLQTLKVKKLKSVQREGNKPFLGWKSALLHTYYMFF